MLAGSHIPLHQLMIFSAIFLVGRLRKAITIRSTLYLLILSVDERKLGVPIPARELRQHSLNMGRKQFHPAVAILCISPYRIKDGCPGDTSARLYILPEQDMKLLLRAGSLRANSHEDPLILRPRYQSKKLPSAQIIAYIRARKIGLYTCWIHDLRQAVAHNLQIQAPSDQY